MSRSSCAATAPWSMAPSRVSWPASRKPGSVSFRWSPRWKAEGERAVQLGLTVSILLHLTILGWAFVSLQSPEPFRVSEPEPVEVALVTAEDIVRLTKGDRSAKQLEAQQAETQRKPLEEGKAKPKIEAAAPPPPPPPPKETAKPPPKEDPIA